MPVYHHDGYQKGYTNLSIPRIAFAFVDRVWPREMRKDQVQADLWLKDVAPSAAHVIPAYNEVTTSSLK